MLYAIVAVLVLIADQWLKYWVTANVVLDTGSIELIPGFIKLVDIHNDGATLGILSGARWLFVVLAAVFAVVVIWALAKRAIRGRFGRWMAVLALAGAVGNCIDRVMFGYVVDMFKFEPDFLGWFGIFNIADIFITVCGILFCFYLIFGGRKASRGGKTESSHRHEARKREPEPEPEAAPAKAAPEPALAPAQEPVPAPEADEVSAVSAEPEAERRGAPKHAKHPAEKSAPRHEAKREPAPAPAAEKPAPKKPAADDDMDFKLDDIMDEFK